MKPAFCPNPACDHHHDQEELYAGHWMRTGFYSTAVVGRVQRFICSACGRGFSERTFAYGYYTKRTLDPREIHRAISQSESVSSIARHLGASTASIQNRIDRLARASLAMHARLSSTLRLREHLVADGFESFDRSQFFPNQINLLVGQKSQFLYGLTHVTTRRKGRMTASQKDKRQRLELLWRAPRGGTRLSFGKLIASIDALWDRASMPRLQLWTDEHRDYPPAIMAARPLRDAVSDGSFIHHTWPSTAPRDLHNPLFAANYYDRELRKDLAALRRESTCFTRNVANGLSRLACHMAYHNYQKPHRVIASRNDDSVHALKAGIGRRAIEASMVGLYAERPFISRCVLNANDRRIWLKESPTPLKRGADYLPAFAC